MSEIRATLQESARGFHVAGQETIEFDLMYVDGVFMPANPELADVFSDRGRCLMVIDEAVLKLYGEQIWEYFEHHGIALTTLASRSRRPTRAWPPSSRSSTGLASSACGARSRCSSSGAG
jgi:hypothetical protein